MKKVIFYIDGFNFYYALRKASSGNSNWKKYYWIDLVKLCSLFLKDDEQLIKVKYFTARPKNRDKRERQNRLMKANSVVNNGLFEVIYGSYKEKTVKCLANCRMPFKMPEEKQSDVNVAISMVEDYVVGICDKTVLISADSDLIPPLKSISKLSKMKADNHKIEILLPPSHFNGEIHNLPFTVKMMKGYKSRFNKAILPKHIPNKGKNVVIPKKWEEYLD